MVVLVPMAQRALSALLAALLEEAGLAAAGPAMLVAQAELLGAD